MLVPSDMIGPQSKLMFQVNKFCGERVHARKYAISKTVREVCKVVQGRDRDSVQGDTEEFAKPPVDLVPTVPAAGWPLL